MVNQSEDAALVKNVLDGNLVVFGDLYDRYVGLVRAVCADATGQMQDIDDLTQEIFLRAHKRLHTLQDATKFGAWLVGIARLTAKEWRRARGRERAMTNSDPDALQFGADSVASAEEFAKLRQAISQLKENERLALHLFYLQEEPADIARSVMGLSRSGFYRVLERAKKNLATKLSQEIGVNHG